MANPNAPFGFRPVGSLSGAEVRVRYYPVATSAVAIGKGDLLTLDASGTVKRVTAATSTGPFIGVAMQSLAATPAAGTKVAVCDDDKALFECQGGFTAAVAITQYNINYKATCGTAPDANTSVSKHSLSKSTCSTAVGIRLLARVPDASNEAAATERLIVKINSHYNANGAAAV